MKLILLETPTNPLLHNYDIQGIQRIVEEYRALKSSKYPLFIVDMTFSTPLQKTNPLELGIDMVMHSATKYLSGHSDVIAGVISTNNDELYS